jgi:hypothetical protein
VVGFIGTLNLQVLYNTPAQTVQDFCSPATNVSAFDCNTFRYTAQAALSKISVRASSTLRNVPPSNNSAFKRPHGRPRPERLGKSVVVRIVGPTHAGPDMPQTDQLVQIIRHVLTTAQAALLDLSG